MSQLKKALLTPEVGKPIEVLFNPSEYTVERSVNYASHAIPGLDVPVAQFINGNADTLTLSLFFDTMNAPEAGSAMVNAELMSTSMAAESSKLDVRDFTQKVYSLMDVNGELHAPPKVQFSWGSFSFDGYIVSINQRFTMFTGGGIPVRATLDVRLNSVRSVSDQLRGTPRNSPDRTKYVLTREGDSLWAIAWREYDDCSLWREIANANGIENPRVLRSGLTLRVPAIL